MSKFALVVFPDEMTASQGFHLLDELHGERSPTVYGAAVIARDESGALSVKKRTAEVPLGVRLGVLVGGLRNEFLESIRRELVSGTFAVIAELSDWVTPLDAQMEALGGRTVCEWWDGFTQVLLDQRTDLRGARLAAESIERQRRRRRRSSGWQRS